MIDLKQFAHAASPTLYRRLQSAYSGLGDWLFDAYFGVWTDARPDDGIEAHTTDSVEYRPTQLQVIRRVFRLLGVSSDDVFLDLGAGKGRVVVQAARLPFRRVIGVEISEQLSVQARRNVDRLRGRLACRSIDIVTADASAYAIPDDVSVIYLFNPFRGETFATVTDNIVRSYERRARRITVVYFLPTMHDCLLANGFRVLREELSALQADGTPNAGRTYLAIYALGGECD